jgi:uncharacterized protein with HEPN domain/predicted nucleotidyltransferase
MNRATVLSQLKRHEAELSRRFGVASLTLFGSFARDQATDHSDVDILARFHDAPDIKSLLRTQSYLEEVLGRTVDLVLWDELREEIRPYVERDILMPDSPSLPREWRLYIQDMIEFCEKILSYTDSLERSRFLANDLIYDATLRNMELIGEAANRIPNEVREANPDIPWGEIIGTRNRLAHAYRDIYDDVVWKIVCDDIPDMLPRLRNILEQPTGEPD